MAVTNIPSAELTKKDCARGSLRPQDFLPPPELFLDEDFLGEDFGLDGKELFLTDAFMDPPDFGLEGLGFLVGDGLDGEELFLVDALFVGELGCVVLLTIVVVLVVPSCDVGIKFPLLSKFQVLPPPPLPRLPRPPPLRPVNPCLVTPFLA
jgi:hypothetical protein